MIDLNNTWCEANEENYKKLLGNLNCTEGIYLNVKTDKYIYIDEYKQIQSTSLNIGVIVDLKIYKQICLVNGEFQYVEINHKNNFNCYKSAGVSNSKYSLKPIKKEWYEKPDNFPCILIDDLKEPTDQNKFWYCPSVEIAEQAILFGNLRPATKKEVLELVIKE